MQEFLASILDPAQVTTEPAQRVEHSIDWGTDEANSTRPAAVVYPTSTADVQAVLQAAHERSIPVTPYGGGTSTQGHSIPAPDGISMDLSRMDTILDVRPEARQVTVQPGVVGSDLNDRLADDGLVFPSLPASAATATIGGMIATGASGLGTVKYGEIRDRVLGLEAVLADGTIINTGTRALKSSSGYNLTDLLVGSEGTLAVVTKATLSVVPQPRGVAGGRAVFEDRHSASIAVSAIVRSELDIAKLELVDATAAAMANAYVGSELPDQPMLFVEFHGQYGQQQRLDAFRELIADTGVTQLSVTTDKAELERIWAIRRELGNAMEPYDPGLTPIGIGDVAVPIDRVTDLIGAIEELAVEYDVLIPCFGHVGDGNVHYSIMARVDDPEHQATCERLNERIMELAVEFGGTVTGEHGIGTGKQDALAAEHDEATLAVMEAIKTALDPAGILNPGTAIKT